MTKDFDQMFDELRANLDLSNQVRNIIITKLLSAVESGDVDLKDMSAERRESFMSIVRELNSTLKSRDSSHINMVKLQMQDKRDDQDAQDSQVVAEFLKHIKLSTPAKTPAEGEEADPDAAMKAIESEFEKRELVVEDDELLHNDEVVAG